MAYRWPYFLFLSSLLLCKFPAILVETSSHFFHRTSPFVITFILGISNLCYTYFYNIWEYVWQSYSELNRTKLTMSMRPLISYWECTSNLQLLNIIRCHLRSEWKMTYSDVISLDTQCIRFIFRNQARTFILPSPYQLRMTLAGTDIIRSSILYLCTEVLALPMSIFWLMMPWLLP